MNIMKTNMLLLDNRIKKDDAENSTVEAPIPSPAPDAKTGMKALMFQGMQNLMADPSLAKQVGIMNEDSDDNKNNNASNIAFKGVFNNAAITAKNTATAVGNKMKQYSLAGIMMASTLLPSVLTLTGCKDRESITNISVKVDVDQQAMMALIASLQSTLTQMLLTQQMTLEEFNKYMEQTEAWRKQVEQRLANFELILTSMADNIFDLNNNVKNGFDENNAYQRLIISMLEQFMTRDEAIELFNKLFAEVASGNKSVAQALAEIMEALHLVNQNLNTIIANQDRAYAQMEDVKGVLQNIEGNTAEARDAAVASYERLGVINNTLVEGFNNVSGQLSKLDGDMKFGFAATAQAINLSTQQLGNFINRGVMTIVANNNWNAMMVKAAIDYNTQITKEGNAQIEKFYKEFIAGKLTAEEFAQKMLDVVNSIDSKMDTLINSFNSYAENMQKAAKYALIELRKGNLTAAQTKELVKDVISNQQKAYAMLETMNQNIDKLDDDVIKGNQQVVTMLKWLGYTEAQIAGMSTAAIRQAIRGASDKLIATLGGKLDTIIDKMNNGGLSDSEGIAQMIALLEQIAGDVSEIKSSVADLNAKFDALMSRINKLVQYARGSYYENKYQSGVVTYIAGELNGIGNDIKDIKATEEAILEKLENGESLTAEEMEIIIARLGNGIHQDLSGVKALLRADVAQNNVIINLVARAVQQLNGLGSISQDILNEIANLGDNLDGLSAISDKLDALIEAVNNLSTKFDKYAKSALDAHAQEIAFLRNIKNKTNVIIEQNQTLINQGRQAEIQRAQIDNDIKSLKNLVRQINAKLGRSITPEELDSILAKHDADNQAFYAELISKTTLNPQDYTDALEYLTQLAEILVTGQGQTNQNLLTLIELVKKYPQYKDQIIEAINNITIEVTCQGDCDHNNQVTEGIIQIVQ